MAKKTPTTKKKTKAKSVPAGATIQHWATDPIDDLAPVQSPSPALPGSPLPTEIIDSGQAPAPQVYSLGTPEFRYWTAAEALRRTALFWSTAGATAWHGNIGTKLPIRLDDGVDLNAYYARNDFLPGNIKKGLSFFHDTVRDLESGQQVTVFSGESPDVIAHEMGHAILDALKPALWGVATTEAAAFHESFGDQSAILTALQLPGVRQAVLEETDGRLWRNSTVSRVAEQLGWAIRQRNPSAVDPDSLRNAANSFVWADPVTLPPGGPASGLTRAPHNFSRIFTGAFLEALGGMVLTLADPPHADDILQASQDMGALLARAVVNAPVRTRFFQAVAEELLLADNDLFNGKYAEALTTALVRRGLLPIRSLAAPAAVAASSVAAAAAAVARASALATGVAEAAGAVAEAAMQTIRITLDGASLGLPVLTLSVEGPAIDDGGPPPLGVAGEAAPMSRVAAVQAFVEGLVLRGHIALEARVARGRGPVLMAALARKHLTHSLVRVNSTVELQRVTFDCSY